MIKGHLLWVEKSQIWFLLFRKWKINSEWEEELQKYLLFLGLICDYFFFLYFQMPSFSLNLRQGVMELKKIWGWPDNSYMTGDKFTLCQGQSYGMHWGFLYLLPLGQSSLLSVWNFRSSLCISAQPFSSLMSPICQRLQIQASYPLIGAYNMSLFSCSLFSGTISVAGGCILEFASHHGSTVVPLVLEGPFLPLPVCKGCVYTSPFSPCCHLSTGRIIWAALNNLCLSWETVARYRSANQHGSAPSTSLIRSLQTCLEPWFQGRWHEPHVPPLCFDVVLFFQAPPQSSRFLAWMADPLFFGDGPDAVFACEKLEFFPAKQAALGMAWGHVSSAQQHISFDHYPN